MSALQEKPANGRLTRNHWSGKLPKEKIRFVNTRWNSTWKLRLFSIMKKSNSNEITFKRIEVTSRKLSFKLKKQTNRNENFICKIIISIYVQLKIKKIFKLISKKIKNINFNIVTTYDKNQMSFDIMTVE